MNEKINLSNTQKEKRLVIAMLFIHNNIKFLIDNNIIYHYTDRIAMGKYNSFTKEIDFYFETQEEYDIAIKSNDVVVKRTFENYSFPVWLSQTAIAESSQYSLL